MKNTSKVFYGIMAVKAVTIPLEAHLPGEVDVRFKTMDSLNYSRGDFQANAREAERLQSEFDEDCDPVRVYVYEQQSRDAAPIPVYAAFCRRTPSFGMEYEMFRLGLNPEFERMFP